MRILLVEDTIDVGEAVVARLGMRGHRIDWECDGTTAFELLKAQSYDLVILDVMLPGMSGFEILRGMRLRRLKTPVLFLTARSEVDNRVDALETGADDYLVKPFDFRELEARVQALLRRGNAVAASVATFGDLEIDFAARRVKVGDRMLSLTRREMTLLEVLASHPGRYFSKQELIDHLFALDDEPSENAVEQYIARLRRKISPATAVIETNRGLGYSLVAP